MNNLLLLARLLLSLTFGVAGVAKLSDLGGSRQALAGFGVPENLSRPLAWLLPIAELLTAVTLLPLATAGWGSGAALAMLLVFLAGIGVKLARGQAPACHCFGQLHSEPVSWTVFARNAVLAVVAVGLVWQGPGASLGQWLSHLTTGEAISLCVSLLTAGLAAAAFVMLRRVLQQQSALVETVTAMQRLIEEDYAEPAPVERQDVPGLSTGLPVGAPAPAFALPTLNGHTVALADLLALDKAVLLLFISPQCAPCKSLLPLVRTWQRDYDAQLTIVLLTKGTAEEARDKLKKYEPRYLLLQGESEVAADYEAQWTPAAVLVNRQGRIASPLTMGNEAIRALITHTVATDESAAPPPIRVGSSLFSVGELAPRFALPDAQGTAVSFAERLTRPSLLLFWNPGCGFCQGMAEALKRWEAHADAAAPQVIFVSTGTAAEVKAAGTDFRGLFLHDEANDIAPLFGANGTPSALLLTAEGRIASSLAVGERNIFSLLGWRKTELPIAPQRSADPLSAPAFG